MKIWLLLTTTLLSFGAIAVENNGNNEQGYEETEDEEFEGFYDDEDFVSISTGTKKSLPRAPSVASVITAKKIKQMGFRTLSEVLATVPGLHVSFSSELLAPKFIIRGITSAFNPQALMLVNGTPISSLARGDRHAVWGEFPVAAIARVEVIRGPGSALHGADAFAGVINVITKTYDDIKQTEVGVRAGNFNTKNIWAQSAVAFGELKVALSAEFMNTDGHDSTINSDAQTNLDANFVNAPAASLAPGQVNVGFKGYDLRTDLSYGDLTLKVGYQDRTNVGSGQGLSNALDPHGKFASDKVLINLNYITKITDFWDVDLRLSHYRSNQTIDQYLWLLPPGAFDGAYPEGFSGNPSWFEKNQIAKGRFTYSGLSRQTITFGGGFRNEDLYRVLTRKNFGPNGFIPDFAEFSSRIAADKNDIFLPEAERQSYFAYVQDEVQMAPDWELTVGLRYDHYSDFGTTINPRLALVWATNRNLSTKFLYGKAFRAPTFVDIHIANNPLTLGNKGIQPESISTYEVAFNYQFSPQVHIDLNLYYLAINDAIDYVPDIGKATATAQNVGELNGRGLELEMNYKVTDTFRLLTNYAYQNVENQNTNDDLGDSPNHQAYTQLIWSVDDSIDFNTEVRYIGQQKRNSRDIRAPTDSSVSVAFSLNYHDLFDGVNLQLKINNAFDEDIREPSRGPAPTAVTPTVSIAGDLPQAGRAFFISLQKTF